MGRWCFDGKKIPLFYTPHGYSFLMSNHSRGKRFLYRLIETITAKRQCTTISCSYGEHQETLNLTKNAVYVNNGINVKKLRETMNQVESTKHPLTVFTLGRICYQKNPSLFNEIASAMPDARFVWIGDGELRQELVSANIEVTGWIDRISAIQCAIQGDVFLLTSRWEGLPMSLLEAMYMKKLCVVTDVIGNRDVICNKKNGFVCKKLDEFIQAIRSDKTDYIEQAFHDIEERYTISVMAQGYVDIYKKALIG